MAASVSYFAHLCDGLQVHPPPQHSLPNPKPNFRSLFSRPQAVAAHAGRSAIEPADVAVAFKRQRLTSGTKSLADLLHAQLPMECVDALVPKARAVAK